MPLKMSSKRPKSASRVRPVDQGFYSDMLNHGSEQPDVDQAQLVEENLQVNGFSDHIMCIYKR